ncbi:MAG: hypothetical protein QXR17_07325 [Candidatus Bathyarchaeia archaeon]
MEKRQLTLPYFLNKKDEGKERRDEELLKLQERLGVYAWILFS